MDSLVKIIATKYNITTLNNKTITLTYEKNGKKDEISIKIE